MSNYEKIKEFHAKFGRQPDPVAPTVTNEPSRYLRGTLILEEMNELFAELGLELGIILDNEWNEYKIKLLFTNKKDIDLSKVAKEISDLLYVTYGTAASMGLPIDEVYTAVHESNMSKLGKNGEVIRREDGKILKGLNYKEPDIKSIIEN